MSQHCPLCQHPGYVVKHAETGYPGAMVVSCGHCHHLYSLLDHEPDPRDVYNDEVYSVVEIRSSIFDKILSWEYKRVIKKINKLKPNKGSLLDFGAGKGKFGSLATQEGWEVKAVETAVQRAAYANRVYGLEVSTDYYSSGKVFDLDFDVLTLFHVLEHLPDPTNLLCELIRHNLKADALILVEVPNINSWQSRIARHHWMHLDLPRHISHFTPRRLEQFIAGIAVKPVRISWFSVHLGVLGMTDSLLKLFGYRKNIIVQLKNKKSISLLAAVILLFPVAWMLEALASAAGRGGVVRMYCLRSQ